MISLTKFRERGAIEMFKFIRNIIQTIKELKELDKTPYEWTKTTNLTAKELEEIGKESFENAKRCNRQV